MQLFIDGHAPLTQAEEVEARAFFLRVRQKVCRRVFGGGGRL
jgi:hypothetical protein